VTVIDAMDPFYDLEISEDTPDVPGDSATAAGVHLPQ
jgi:hypothetical protein